LQFAGLDEADWMTDRSQACARTSSQGRPSFSGMHVADDGLVRWTLYRCGHVLAQMVTAKPQPPLIDS
jgi:hypothetical protein